MNFLKTNKIFLCCLKNEYYVRVCVCCCAHMYAHVHMCVVCSALCTEIDMSLSVKAN